MSDDSKKRITFDPDVVVRESLSTDGEISYPLDDPSSRKVTENQYKNKTDNLGTTRFGFSETTPLFDKKQAAMIKAAEKQSRYDDSELNLEKMRAETHRRKYGDECDDGQPCCGDKCTILGGKKTKRRRYTRKYTKKHRSRKSRRSKKGSKNNKK